jgi:hypothetical protein
MEPQMLDEQAYRRFGCFRRRVRIAREGVRQPGEIAAAGAVDDQMQIQSVEADVGEGPGPAEQAGDAEIDEQPLESGDRSAVGFPQPGIVQLDGQQEGVHAHLAGAGLPLEGFLCVGGNRALDQVRQQQKAQQGVDSQDRRDDVDAPVADHSGEWLAQHRRHHGKGGRKVDRSILVGKLP